MIKKSYSTHVLHVASGDLWAGAEAQLFTLAKALNGREDTELTVVLLNYGTLEKKLLGESIRVIVLDEAKFNGFQILLKLISAMRNAGPDIVHTHRIKENILGSIAAFFTGNIISLRTSHGAPEHKPKWHQMPKRVFLFVDWFCGRYLQKNIIAVSRDLSNILQKTFPKNRITVIENGIDIDAFTSQPQSKKLTETIVKVGIAGRLAPVKRIDLFIQAAQHLKQHNPELEINFHIYGDGPLLNHLKDLNQNLGTEKIVHIEGHCDNLQEELQTLDMLLMTSDHEGLPMVLLEAMVLQIPIISHAVGGIPDLLNHGECGILTKEHTSAAYSDAILQLIKDPEMKATLSTNAFNRVKETYSAKSNAEAYSQLYHKLLSP